MNFLVHFPSQLREHLRALRKERGLTQAALGQLIGVGQARIAEIESNPGVVSVDQLMKVLSALSVSILLRDDETGGAADRAAATSMPSASQTPKAAKQKSVQSVDAKMPAGRRWRTQPLTGAASSAQDSALVSASDARGSSGARTLREADPHRDVAPASRRNFIIIRPKKGSW